MVVGRKLWELGRRHQVLCVTHLPQIASFGDTHFGVAKSEQKGRTLSRVTLLEGDARVGELAQMLGTVSDSTRRSAEDLIETVGAAKREVESLE
jgi:DNA repair protein RecN (Recombination protein N)